jgi:LacI family transcriptional regulator, gluconate utilization system Gnt-I transcriptional repressor
MAEPTTTPPTPAATRPRRARRGGGGITLHEVARLAEVSPITASRALNSPKAVAPETLARVLAAVEKTGYVRNRLASGLASSRSRLVAGVVPTVVGPVFQELLQSLSDAFAAAGYQFMMGQSGYSPAREDELLEAIIGRRPDGIVLTGTVHSEAGRRRLVASGIPVCETWDLTDTPIDMVVGFSHEKVGREVAGHLVATGRRRPAVLTGNDARAIRRRDGFAAGVADAGMAWCPLDGVPTGTVAAPTTAGSGRTGLIDLLARHPDTDSIFCSSDLLAIGVLVEARTRGIRVPDDLAVVGFGDLALARDFEPALTTVRIDGTTIGRMAARFIVDRVEGRPVDPRCVDVGFSIVRRASS